MELLDGLGTGFSVALDPMNLIYVSLGVLLGTVIGLLPGLGPTTAVAVLIPLTLQMDPTSAIIMLAGIYYGSMYGGRIPAILLNLPGDSSSVITTLDGYPLTKQGKGGTALGLTAIGSFLGGTVAIVGLTLFAPVVARFAVTMGAPEMFLLASLGLLMVAFLGSGSKLKALSMAGFGLILASVGYDAITGSPRLTFGSMNLSSGIHVVPLAVGLFGFSEIFMAVDRGLKPGMSSTKLGKVLPSLKEWAETRMAILRSSIIGFFLGVLPGGGGTLSSIIAYGAQRRASKNPQRFGKGSMDGLAATESADNSSSSSSFIPLLTLGLPPNPVLAVIFGALLLHNITPGPRLISDHPDVFWGIIASMYIGNVLLLVFNLPLIRVFVQILKIRSSVMLPVVIIIAICGVYSAENSMFNVALALFFGVVGYVLKKFKFDITPLMLAFILGPIIESEFRRSMLMGGGALDIFIQRPISFGLVTVLTALIAFIFLNSIRRRFARTVE